MDTAKTDDSKQKLVCACCGKEIPDGDEYITTHDDETVCASCRDAKYIQCGDCREWYRADEVDRSYNGDPLCNDCYENNDYFTCDECGEVASYDDEHYVTHDGADICEDCYHAHYFTCADCDEVYPIRRRIERADGEYICDQCYDTSYFTCERCDRVLHTDYYHGDGVCDDCHEEYCPEGVHDYHDFAGSYRPRRLPGEKQDELTFGVELECDDGEFQCDDFTDWTDDDDLVHFEHDGSLTDQGVECITMPCTLGFHEKKMRWDDLCSGLIGQGFLSHKTSTCGLHVHIGRKNLSITDIVKMDVWLNRWQLMKDLARRNTIFSGRYDPAKRCDISHAIGNSYDYSDRLRKYKKNWCHGERYQPLNTTNERTVEVRIFRGTLKCETVLATIEAMHAMCKFAMATPIKRVYDTHLPAEYLRYIADNGNLYPHVFPALKRLAKASKEPEEVMGIISKNCEDADPNEM